MPDQAAPAAAAAPGPGHLVVLAPTDVAVNSEFMMEVQVADIAGLFSAPLFVTYDPALLEMIVGR